jgi:myosin-1
MYQRKERRALSLNRKFYGDYIGLEHLPGIRSLLGKRENVEFAQTSNKFDRTFKKQKRDFVLTNKALYIIGREQVKDQKTKTKSIKEVLKRRIEYNAISKIVLSRLQDNILVIYPCDLYASVLEIEYKTEFLTVLSRKYKESLGKPLSIEFNDM